MDSYLRDYGELYSSKLQLKEQIKEIDSQLKTKLKVIETYMCQNDIPSLPITVNDNVMTLNLEKACKLKK